MGLSGVGCSSHTVFRAVVAIRGNESADCTKDGTKISRVRRAAGGVDCCMTMDAAAWRCEDEMVCIKLLTF